MPPALSDDEMIDDVDDDVPDEIPAKKKQKVETGKAKPVPTDEEDGEVEDVEAGGDEDDEEEYQVDKIVQHKIKSGQILYQVKWLGYEDKNDMTWEPADNLAGAKDAVRIYHDKIGGTPEATQKTKRQSGKGFSTEPESTPVGGKKRVRKSAASRLEADEDGKRFVPPAGSWEDRAKVTAITDRDEHQMTGKRSTNLANLEAMLLWDTKHKTVHSLAQLRQKCPLRLLDYYEEHLMIPRLEELANEHLASVFTSKADASLKREK